MFTKKEGPENLTIEELAQNVRNNEARVERQRKEIEVKEYQLMDKLSKPPLERNPRISTSSFDAAEIESKTKTYENDESIFSKIRALDDALAEPSCCDRQYLDSIREYLKAARPAVETLEAKQWGLIGKIQELSNQIQQFYQELNQADQQIKDLLKLAHLTCNGREFDKTQPMNGFWGIKNTIPVTQVIDYAITDCKDGNKYAIGRSFSAPTTPLATKYISSPSTHLTF